MNFEFEKDSFLSLQRLANNKHYYNHIFKRAERIASVVFYVLSHIELTDSVKIHHGNLSDKAMKLHEAAIGSLTLQEYEAKDNLHDLLQALIALQSAIRIATAARVFTNNVERVLVEEVDILIRLIKNHYMKSEEGAKDDYEPLLATGVESTKKNTVPSIAPKTSTPKPVSSTFGQPKTNLTQSTGERIERIKTVLEAKGEATIKDIAEIISDCSEKTIQRDLIQLIDKGEVIREGERRWSKYRVIK